MPWREGPTDTFKTGDATTPVTGNDNVNGFETSAVYRQTLQFMRDNNIVVPFWRSERA